MPGQWYLTQKFQQLHYTAACLQVADRVHDICAITLGAMESILGFMHCSIGLEQSGCLRIQAVSKRASRALWSSAVVGKDHVGRVFLSGKPKIVQHCTEACDGLVLPPDTKSHLIVPIGKIGVFQAFSKKERHFSESDVLLSQTLLLHTQTAIERVLHLQKLQKTCYFDALTGLYNRAYLESRIEGILASADLPIVIAFGEVNGLKLINDVFGQDVGDQLLVRVGSELQQCFPSESLVVRWDGAKFLVVQPRTDYERAEEQIKTFQCQLRQCTLLAEAIPVCISFGVAMTEEQCGTFRSMLARAERKLDAEKLEDSKSFGECFMHYLQQELIRKQYEDGPHIRNMQTLARKLASRVGMSSNESEGLLHLAALHDIGMIALPAELIHQPGPLSAEEWEKVKMHPASGHRIVSGYPAVASTAESILSHHERYDGNGYPRGLKGEQIPLLARMVAIMDAFERMTSGTCYQPRKSLEAAVHELEEGAGSYFDPHLVPLVLDAAGGAS